LLLCSSYLPLGVPNELFLQAITHSDPPLLDSEDTLIYGAWNKEMDSSLSWTDFDEVSKPNYPSSSDRGKGPLGDDEDPPYEGNGEDDVE
jgi:hypothetical protein